MHTALLAWQTAPCKQALTHEDETAAVWQSVQESLAQGTH